MATFIKRKGSGGRTVWLARVRRVGHPAISGTFNTKAAAQAWAGEIEAKMHRRVFIDRRPSEKVTVGDLVRRYLREITPEKRGAVYEASHAQAILKDPIASIPLAACVGRSIAEYRDRRLAAVRGATVNRELNVLSHVFTVGMTDWGYYLPGGNPVRSARRPRISRGRERRLFPGEEPRLLAACAAHCGPLPLAVVAIWAIETAMRRGEIATMRWEHLDRAARVLRVPETKTGEPRRVPLSSRAMALLADLPRRLDGMVFGHDANSYTRGFISAVRRARVGYEAECATAGVQPDPRMLRDLRFHDLRHEATSRLFERGLNPMEVSAITGHKTLAMLQRYTHLRAEDLVDRLG
jgi:integrase